MKKRVSFHTFGCRLNQAESSAMQSSFRERGYDIIGAGQSSDYVVINTCTVTANGDGDTRKLINQLTRKYPHAEIAVVGCQAQLQSDVLKTMPNVRWVVGNARKMDIAAIIEDTSDDLTAPLVNVDPVALQPFRMTYDAVDEFHTRANLKIQDGCDFFCFFCVIPYARGRARSRQFDDIIREAKNLVAAGFVEIVLTGVNMGTYNHNDKRFLDIVRELLRLRGLKRLRISSLEPTTISTDILDLFTGHSALCRFLHIPLQSGCDDILYRMNRRYTAEEYRQFIVAAKSAVSPLCVGTDVIVGYPGETDAQFDETYDFLLNSPLNYFHVFSYSQRDQAKSRHLGRPVSREVIRNRSRILRQLSDRKRGEFMQALTDRVEDVLFEQRKDGYWSGLTDHYMRVKVASDLNLRNTIRPVRLGRVDGRTIVGELVC